MISEQEAEEVVAKWLASKCDSTSHTYADAIGDFVVRSGFASRGQAAAWLCNAEVWDGEGKIRSYVQKMIDDGLKERTAKLRLAAVAQMVSALKSHGYACKWTCDVKPEEFMFDEDGNPKAKRLTDSEVVQFLVELSERTDAKGRRDFAIVSLLACNGLRRESVRGLNLEDFHAESSTALVLKKGSSQKESISLSRQTRDAIAAWIEHRGTKPGPLFIGLSNNCGGRRMAGNSIHWLVSRLGLKKGQKLWPHAFRHAAATTLMEKTGGDEGAVREYLGHANHSGVKIYDDLSPETESRAKLRNTIAPQLLADVFHKTIA